MSNHFGKNLKFLREQKGLEQIEVAKLLGRKSSSSVSEWEKGTYEPKSGMISDIAKIFGVTMQDLMNKDLTLPDNIKRLETPKGFTNIPILGKISCGEPLFVEENYIGYRTEPTNLLPAGDLVYLQANGDSMSPTVPNEAFVIIRKQPDVESGEIAAVLLNGDTEATLKRIKKQGDIIYLIPDNRDYEPIIVDKDNPARIIGKAIRFTFDL